MGGPKALCSGAPPLRFALFSGANLAPLKTALSHGFTGLGASKTGAEKRACGPGCGRRKGAGKRGKGAGEMRKGCGRNSEMAGEKQKKCGEKNKKWRGESAEKKRGEKAEKAREKREEKMREMRKGRARNLVNAEKDAGENRKKVRGGI